jgi:orotate phosphoribosyltransferase
MGAVPIIISVVAKSQESLHPMKGFWVRKETKEHGTRRLIDGHLPDGANVVIVDDVTTTGGSVLKAIRTVRKLKCKVVKVITVVDRLEGAAEALQQEGLVLTALYQKSDFLS